MSYAFIAYLYLPFKLTTYSYFLAFGHRRTVGFP